MELCTPVLCRPNCNPFVEDPLEDSEILHSGEGGDVERWLEPQNKSFMLRLLVSYSLFLFTFHTCVVVHLA